MNNNQVLFGLLQVTKLRAVSVSQFTIHKASFLSHSDYAQNSDCFGIKTLQVL